MKYHWFAAPNPQFRNAPFRHPSTFVVVKEISRVGGTDITAEVVASMNPEWPIGQQSRRCCLKMRDCELVNGKWVDSQTKADVTPMAHVYSKEVDPQHPDSQGLQKPTKYSIKGKDGVVIADAFVLRPEQDPAALAALKTYAAACREPKLKADLLAWIKKIETEKLGLWREGKNLGSMGRINAGLDKPAT